MAALGALTAFNFMKWPYNLTKMLNYSRISFKYLAKFLITILISLIPIAIFLNPFWGDIDL
jgi:hypothetical protein